VLLEPLHGRGDSALRREEPRKDAPGDDTVRGRGAALEESGNLRLQRGRHVQAVSLRQLGDVQREHGVLIGGLMIHDPERAVARNEPEPHRDLAVQTVPDRLARNAPRHGAAPVELAHERLDRGDVGGVRVRQQRRDRLLLFGGQHVPGLARGDMERVADALQERPGLHDVACLLGRDRAVVQEGLPGAGKTHTVPDLRHPLGGLDIAQPARPFLDVGLDRVHAVAALLLENALPLGPFLEQEVRGEEMGAEFRPELPEQVMVAAEIAGVEQGRLRLMVELAEVADQPVRIAHLHVRAVQEGVHHRLEHVLDDGVEVVIVLAGRDERDVDIRIRGELAAAVTAGRDDDDLRLGGRDLYDLTHGALLSQREDAAQSGVDQCRVVRECVSPTVGPHAFGAVDLLVPLLDERSDSGSGIDMRQRGLEEIAAQNTVRCRGGGRDSRF
jgi:hypothetical protein